MYQLPKDLDELMRMIAMCESELDRRTDQQRAEVLDDIHELEEHIERMKGRLAELTTRLAMLDERIAERKRERTRQE